MLQLSSCYSCPPYYWHTLTSTTLSNSRKTNHNKVRRPESPQQTPGFMVFLVETWNFWRGHTILIQSNIPHYNC